MSFQYTGNTGKIVLGRDYNFFQKLNFGGSADFATECDIIIPFSTYTVTFQLESGGPVSYSFNGNTVHGDMTTGKSSASLTFENRVISKIWFKGTAGVIRVEAWSIR
jgi:hypothetical protein